MQRPSVERLQSPVINRRIALFIRLDLSHLPWPSRGYSASGVMATPVITRVLFRILHKFVTRNEGASRLACRLPSVCIARSGGSVREPILNRHEACVRLTRNWRFRERVGARPRRNDCHRRLPLAPLARHQPRAARDAARAMERGSVDADQGRVHEGARAPQRDPVRAGRFN
jgi:hypothetical protein